MPAAEILTIGTELLLGEIQDTNTRFLARALRDIGLDIFRTTTVGDNPARIAQAIREALGRCDILLTTGGLGPTVDDPTRQAVADAFGVELVYLPALWEQIQERFRSYGRREASDNNRRQAYIPAGAIPLENPVGTAPAFIVEQAGHAVICLPGVPREMETLYHEQVYPYLKEHYHLTAVIRARVLHVAGMGESQVDELVGDLERQSNPTVGLLASPGRVDIRITAKGESEDDITARIQALEQVIRGKLGDAIYGADEETLESVTLKALEARDLDARLILNGFGDNLAGRLGPGGRLQLSLQPEVCDDTGLEQQWRDSEPLAAAILLLASLQPGEHSQKLQVIMKTPHGEERFSRSYGGPSQMAPAWAEMQCLDHVRRTTIQT